MSKIKITLPEGEIPVTGKLVSFIAPCTCEEVDGVIINSTIFSFVDACGNNINGIHNIFSQGALVSVVLDVTNLKAYIQNAANTKYAAYYEIPTSFVTNLNAIQKYRIYAPIDISDDGDVFDCKIDIVANMMTGDQMVVTSITQIISNDTWRKYFDFEILGFIRINDNGLVHETMVYEINGERKMVTYSTTLSILEPSMIQIENAQKILAINI